jgi:hypothetical protein
MSFEVFERRLSEKLEALFTETDTFYARWSELKRTLVEPMLKSAAKTFTDKNIHSVCQAYGSNLGLFATNRGQDHRLRFSANADRLQAECAAISYPQGAHSNDVAEAGIRYFALEEISQLTIEKIVLEYADMVVRAKPAQ